MKRRGYSSLLVLMGLLLSCSIAYAQSQQITNRLNYLTAIQNSDGSSGNEMSGTEILPSTIAAIETLKALNQTDMQNYSNAFLWLQTQGLETTDYLSERSHALSVAGADRD